MKESACYVSIRAITRNEITTGNPISNVIVLTKIQQDSIPTGLPTKKETSETILRKKSTKKNLRKNLFMFAISCVNKLVYFFAKLVYISACLVL